jgi:hypothetical protein
VLNFYIFFGNFKNVIPFENLVVFIIMNDNKTKNKHIRIRITTEQLGRLCMIIQEERTTKSQFLREAIEEKLNQFCRRKNHIDKSSLMNDYTDYIQARKGNIQ